MSMEAYGRMFNAGKPRPPPFLLAPPHPETPVLQQPPFFSSSGASESEDLEEEHGLDEAHGSAAQGYEAEPAPQDQEQQVARRPSTDMDVDGIAGISQYTCSVSQVSLCMTVLANVVK